MRGKQAGPIRTAGFTLTELLVVIVIMAVMMALALPAFQGINKGGAMRSAILEVKTKLSLARQYAITQRTKTYVVFPDNQNASPATYADKDEKLFRAYRAFNVYSEKDAAYISEWTYLPKGIVFYDGKFLGKTVMGKMFDRDYAQLTATLPFDTTLNKRKLCVFSFSPDGSAGAAGSSDYSIYMCEGWAVINTNGGKYSLSPALGEYGVITNSGLVKISVGGLTGTVKVTR